jgi:hypothetical protein
MALDAANLAAELDRQLDLDDGSEALRAWLTAFAESQGIPI